MVLLVMLSVRFSWAQVQTGPDTTVLPNYKNTLKLAPYFYINEQITISYQRRIGKTISLGSDFAILCHNVDIPLFHILSRYRGYIESGERLSPYLRYHFPDLALKGGYVQAQFIYVRIIADVENAFIDSYSPKIYYPGSEPGQKALSTYGFGFGGGYEKAFNRFPRLSVDAGLLLQILPIPSYISNSGYEHRGFSEYWNSGPGMLINLRLNLCYSF